MKKNKLKYLRERREVILGLIILLLFILSAILLVKTVIVESL
jgi:hypothetical protein